MDEHRLYEIGLTLVKGVGDIIARQLLTHCGSAAAIFKEKRQLLEKIPGIGSYITTEIFRPEVLKRAEQELQFIAKNKIQTFFIEEKAYPKKLRECADAPILLYFKGNGTLDHKKILSVVGTRKITQYGIGLTETLISELAVLYPDILIVSGLAYGVDITAHRSALKNNLSTVGVLAHGLDRIYPAAHRNTAIQMIEQGGLLTDFTSETNPDRANFIKRNRIVAGIADATIVVESAEKGGSLITADIAFSYDRDVYAYPGRVNDPNSKGCNDLIRQNKAGLITSTADLISALCWDVNDIKHTTPQQTMIQFDLSEQEVRLVALLEKEDLHINELAKRCMMPVHQISVILFEMEMRSIIKNTPGGIYKLC